MFERIPTNNVVKNGEGDLPATTAIVSNNQIGRYIDRKNATILKNVFSATANGFGKAFYQPNEFTVLQDSYAFKLKEEYDYIDITKVHSFFVASLNKVYAKYDWSYKSGWNKIKKEYIYLPVKNGDIDYNFMIELISELEEERISELKKYLKVTGLDSYALNQEEKKVLATFDKVVWKEYRLEELFEITGTKSLDSNAVTFVKEGINFVGRTFEDNGVQGKLEKQDFEPNEPYTITATVIGNYKYVRCQTEPYYCSQNINKLKPKDIIEKWNKKIAYFFVANIQKFVSQYNYQQGGYKLPDIKNHVIKVPIDSNGKIDYDYIHNLIFALEKEVIKGVVKYADKNIKATKKVVRK